MWRMMDYLIILAKSSNVLIQKIIQYSYIFRDLSNNQLVEIPNIFFPSDNLLEYL